MSVNWTNITTAAGLLAEANTQTEGWFWLGILGVVYAVMAISMIGFGFYPAILASSFAALIFGLLLAYSGLIGWVWVAAIVGIMVLTFIWIGFSSNRYAQ